PAGSARVRAMPSQPLHESVARIQESAADALAATPVEAAPAASAPAASKAVAVARDLSTPLTVVQSVWNGTAPRHIPAPEKQPSKLRPSWPQAIGGLLGLAALGLVAVSGVFLVRAFLSTPFMQDFLAAYPGEYHVDVAPGFAPWVGWQHFFNMFQIG